MYDSMRVGLEFHISRVRIYYDHMRYWMGWMSFNPHWYAFNDVLCISNYLTPLVKCWVCGKPQCKVYTGYCNGDRSWSSRYPIWCIFHFNLWNLYGLQILRHSIRPKAASPIRSPFHKPSIDQSQYHAWNQNRTHIKHPYLRQPNKHITTNLGRVSSHHPKTRFHLPFYTGWT